MTVHALASPKTSLPRHRARAQRGAGRTPAGSAAALRSLLGALALLPALAACGKEESPPEPSGTLEATEVDVAPLLTARALEIRADEGDAVTAGDTLLVLDTDLLRRQHEQAAAHDAVLAAQEREATEQRSQQRRRLELAEITLARTSALQEQGSATLQRVDELRAERDIAASQVRSVDGRLAALAAQRVEVERTLAVLDRQLADGVVRAPISGTVLLRTLEPGEIAAAGAPALRLADLGELELRVYLEEMDLDRVRIGERLRVRVDALEGEDLEGVVRWVSREAEFTPKNAQTRKARAQLVYAVRLTVANPDGRLHIGMPATVRIG